MIPIFKNVGAKSMAKNFNPVSILSVVSKIFEKHLNNSLVYDLKKCGLLSHIQYDIWSS